MDTARKSGKANGVSDGKHETELGIAVPVLGLRKISCRVVCTLNVYPWERYKISMTLSGR